MIHLSEISINPAAIAYIEWNAIAPNTKSTDGQRGVIVRFLVSMAGGCSQEFEQQSEYWFFPAGSQDAKDLEASFGR